MVGNLVFSAEHYGEEARRVGSCKDDVNNVLLFYNKIIH